MVSWVLEQLSKGPVKKNNLIFVGRICLAILATLGILIVVALLCFMTSLYPAIPAGITCLGLLGALVYCMYNILFPEWKRNL